MEFQDLIRIVYRKHTVHNMKLHFNQFLKTQLSYIGDIPMCKIKVNFKTFPFKEFLGINETIPVYPDFNEPVQVGFTYMGLLKIGDGCLILSNAIRHIPSFQVMKDYLPEELRVKIDGEEIEELRFDCRKSPRVYLGKLATQLLEEKPIFGLGLTLRENKERWKILSSIAYSANQQLKYQDVT